MFHENLKKIRKQKGMSQEMLAIQLNIVRQTVSKWEKGHSVPDADMLIKLADILEVDVPTLLGSEVFDRDNKNDIAEHLARIAEQLAFVNRRWKYFWRIVAGIILVIILFTLFQAVGRNTVTYGYVGSVALHKDTSDIVSKDVREWIASCNESGQSYFILFSPCSPSEINEGYAGKCLIYVPEGFSSIDFYFNDETSLFSRGKRLDFQISAPFAEDSTYQVMLLETPVNNISKITMQNLNGVQLSPVITETREFVVFEENND